MSLSLGLCVLCIGADFHALFLVGWLRMMGVGPTEVESGARWWSGGCQCCQEPNQAILHPQSPWDPRVGSSFSQSPVCHPALGTEPREAGQLACSLLAGTSSERNAGDFRGPRDPLSRIPPAQPPKAMAAPWC